MARSSIRIRDNGYREFFRKLREADKTEVTVGVQGTDALQRRGTISMAELARVHEFGFAPNNIPSRSFLRATFDEKQSTYARRLEGVIRKMVAAGQSPRRSMRLLGELVRNDIVDKIRSGIPPALKPETIARKGSITPLIDTGQLINSITVEER